MVGVIGDSSGSKEQNHDVAKQAPQRLKVRVQPIKQEDQTIGTVKLSIIAENERFAYDPKI